MGEQPASQPASQDCSCPSTASQGWRRRDGRDRRGEGRQSRRLRGVPSPRIKTSGEHRRRLVIEAHLIHHPLSHHGPPTTTTTASAGEETAQTDRETATSNQQYACNPQTGQRLLVPLCTPSSCAIGIESQPVLKPIEEASTAVWDPTRHSHPFPCPGPHPTPTSDTKSRGPQIAARSTTATGHPSGLRSRVTEHPIES